jgi:hypothetical protein
MQARAICSQLKVPALVLAAISVADKVFGSSIDGGRNRLEFMLLTPSGYASIPPFLRHRYYALFVTPKE